MAGREYDQETGLYFYRARYYDPKVGRFLSEDPAHAVDGLNFYGYVRNRPVNRIDPMGLQSLPVKMCPGLAYKSGERVPSGVGLCCENGAYVLCADPEKWNQLPDDVRSCMNIHEQVHTREPGRPRGSSCGDCDEPPCTLVTRNETLEDFLDRECRAQWITALCLRVVDPTPAAREAIKNAMAWRPRCPKRPWPQLD